MVLGIARLWKAYRAMSDTPSSPVSAAATIARLARPPRMSELHPIAARFLYSLRLIAVHERAKRDPVPELAMRLGSVEVAAKALALAHEVKVIWPEDVSVGRFCCSLLSPDEATLGALIESAWTRDRSRFDRTADGFIRPERASRLWDGVLSLIGAEVHSA